MKVLYAVIMALSRLVHLRLTSVYLNWKLEFMKNTALRVVMSGSPSLTREWDERLTTFVIKEYAAFHVANLPFTRGEHRKALTDDVHELVVFFAEGDLNKKLEPYDSAIIKSAIAAGDAEGMVEDYYAITHAV